MGIHEQKGQAAYSVESKANARHKLQYGCWWFVLAIFAFSGILEEEGFCPSDDNTKYNINFLRLAASKSKPLFNKRKCLLNTDN